jgi:hypothetical protein
MGVEGIECGKGLMNGAPAEVAAESRFAPVASSIRRETREEKPGRPFHFGEHLHRYFYFRLCFA